ncbi:MAG: HD domain-containing protein [Hespellia sp.]|nr:HD domain-containing protein [Hespellia sp.]
MVRVNEILQQKEYKACYEAISECEKTRIFCRHNMSHFLDVARLAYIESLKRNIKVDKEIIYATAILHDIGRHLQYRENIPHEEASVLIAEQILEHCHFQKEETGQILEAIASHRNEEIRGCADLKGLIYRADKMSRLCFACDAREECNKSDEKKRLEL